jgi:hypothetical protein
MERFLGRKLSPWEHVHHKDEDYTNNSQDNLEVLLDSEHYALHHPKNPVPRHLRPERRAYMRAYLKDYEKRRKTRSASTS